MTTTVIAPLDDPSYEPQHPPVNGEVPDVIAKWGRRSQLRWFRRFGRDLKPRRDWDQYYIHSEHHRGACCFSCAEEADTGVMADGWCCCNDERMGR